MQTAKQNWFEDKCQERGQPKPNSSIVSSREGAHKEKTGQSLCNASKTGEYLAEQEKILDR